MNLSKNRLRIVALATGVAVAAVAAPAQARDGEAYVGLDAGIVIPQDTKIDVGNVNNNAFIVDNKKGWGGDVLVGYDWGFLRTEAELGRQQWKPKSITVTTPISGEPLVGTYAGGTGKTRVTTLMANALLDFGGNDGVGFYAGVGGGRAWVSEHLRTASGAANFVHESDSVWAWQGIAGLRFPVSENFELGLKYKYLNTHRLGMVDAAGRHEYSDAKSHSIMASLLLNFGGHAEAAPPPPPPPPPQTKTCPDGTTVGLYDNCPVPPPPAVAPQGERG
jgi:opacity protein-like surface antigen